MLPDELADGEMTALKLLEENLVYSKVVYPKWPSKYAVVNPSSS